MAERVKVTRVEACETIDRAGRTDEGYDFFRKCWNVVANCGATTFVYPLAFWDYDEAVLLAGRVRSKGDLDPERWWDATPPDVPECFTPEWAERERAEACWV